MIELLLHLVLLQLVARIDNQTRDLRSAENSPNKSVTERTGGTGYQNTGPIKKTRQVLQSSEKYANVHGRVHNDSPQ